MSGTGGMLGRTGPVTAITRAAGVAVRVPAAVGLDPLHGMAKAKASDLRITIVPGLVHALSCCCSRAVCMLTNSHSPDAEAI